MALGHLIRQILSMPPREAAGKVLRHAKRQVVNRLVGRLLRRQCTYPIFRAALEARLPRPDRANLEANAAALRALARDTLAHRFDLLGSGPVVVAYGARYAGFGKHRYGPGPKPAPGQDWRGWIASGLWPGNRVRALSILALIEDSRYRPIDWQADFISGYRWPVRGYATGLAYGHRAGVDVKVPWELARLQHLPPLALAYGLDGDPALVAEFRHQVLDFIGSNPPGWGVNWACAMDVAIRAANIVLARDLFLAFGASFDDPFEEELAAAMLAHARHITGHLEWNEAHRGNHYLADICGLAWIAAYLPQGREADTMLAFAIRQLDAEIERQFLPDGGNFEASTAYHRLSAEMALYTVALVLGLPPERRAALDEYDHRAWQRHPPLQPAPLPWPPFSATVMERLARAVGFAHDVTKPSGAIVQVGDNDSGRFFILTPGLDPLDCSHLAAAGQGLFELDAPVSAQVRAETAIVSALVSGPRHRATPHLARDLTAEMAAEPARQASRVIIALPPGALAGLEAIAYPDFGLFIWRNARTFLSVRCGPIGQNGQGGHAHNDQLAIEVEVDGVAWARDPGTFVYTADLAARNAYRSASAHFVPRRGDEEPARLLSPFALEDRAQARALHFDAAGFLGCHHGFGETVWRRVTHAGERLVIEDCWGGSVIGPDTAVEEHTPRDPSALATLWGLILPFSAGYGRRDQA